VTIPTGANEESHKPNNEVERCAETKPSGTVAEGLYYNQVEAAGIERKACSR
jgi:hypothetical protein